MKTRVKSTLVEDGNMSNICFICTSRFQILNCLGLIRYNDEIKNNKIDVYIKSGLIDNSSYFTRQIELFYRIDHVYVYTEWESEQEKLIDKIMRVSNSSKYLSRYGIDKKKIKKYKQIYFAVPSYFASAIVFANKDAHIYWFEDGLGTYSADLVKQVYTPKAALAHKLFKNDCNRLYPAKIYVNNKSFFYSELKCEIEENKGIRADDSEYISFLSRIFGTHLNCTEKKYRWIYLTQPIEEYEGYSVHTQKKEEYLIDLLREKKNNGIVRLHPRDKKEYSFTNYDKGGGLWELQYLNYSNCEKMVLIGYSSAAQFIPKMIYDMEPYVIFTYKMFGDLLVDDVTKNGVIKMVNLLKKNYRRTDRIYLPESIKEYELIINRILC